MPFQRGQSGNPNGRRRGIANELTKSARARIETEVDPIGFLASVMKGGPVTRPDSAEGAEPVYPALSDRVTAARVLANKLVPEAKDRPLSFKVGTISGPADALGAMARVIEAMSSGEVTPSEASAVMGVIETYSKTWEIADLEQRVAALERSLDITKT